MITVSICEDELCFASRLRALLDEYGRLNGVSFSVLSFSSGEQLLASRQLADLILLDIKLPGCDGMDVARRLRALGSGCQVVFITAYPAFVFRAFDVDALHFIVKPVTAETLFPVLDKAVRRIASDSGKTLPVSNGIRAVRIPLRDILFCDALNHRITVHTQADAFSFSGTLDAVQDQLDDRFFRCHRSFLVNLDHIAAVQPGSAVVTGGGEVPVARRKQRELAGRLLGTCRKGAV